MSAIPKDAADIPTHLPHPTGAATVIDINSVVPPFTTTPSPASSFSSSPSSYSASSSSASPSRPESRDSALPPPSRLESRDSQLPPSRDLSLEAHQAEYRAHAYLANESIVATKLAADKFLQNLFKTQTEPDKDILRAASAASLARLQNPFAYNTSRSSGSSGSSGSSSGSSSSYSGTSRSSGSSDSRSSSSTSNSSSNPSVPHTPPQTPRPASPTPAPIAPAPSDDGQPLTEADFTDCIKLEDAVSNIPGTATAPAVVDEPTAATTAAQPNPVKLVAAPTPAAASDLAFWPFGNLAISPPQPPCHNLATWPFAHLTISPCSTSWPHGP